MNRRLAGQTVGEILYWEILAKHGFKIDEEAQRFVYQCPKCFYVVGWVDTALFVSRYTNDSSYTDIVVKIAKTTLRQHRKEGQCPIT